MPVATAVYPMPTECQLLTPPVSNGSWTRPPAQPLHGEVMVITPMQAQRFLDQAWETRRVSPARVRAMAEDMVHGRWDSNGESIIIDAAGRLVDGRHRLSAVVQTGMAIPFLVVTGVNPAARFSVDQGANRTTRDHLAVHQIGHAQELSSAAKWLYRLLHGMARCHTVPLRPVELPRFIANHPELAPQVLPAKGLKPLLPQGLAIALLSIFHGKEPALELRFLQQLKSGLELRQTDPAYVLRERLLTLRSGYSTHATQVVAGALVVLSWNALRRGQSVKQLSWKGTQDLSVPFPPIE